MYQAHCAKFARMKRIIVPFISILLGMACSGSSGDSSDEVQLELNRAKTLWSASGIDSYSLRFRRSCFCLPSATLPVLIEVTDGELTSVSNEATGAIIDMAEWKNFLTVDEIFEEIQKAVNLGADSIHVEYSPEFGYPKTVSIDYIEAAADDEVSYFTELVGDAR